VIDTLQRERRSSEYHEFSLHLQTDFVDFLDRCFEWKPERRMSPSEAFHHPWIRAGIEELKSKLENKRI
jgi:dual specificity tyrosine-phosphorylation-regulated kinase 2/3/4